ncbi:MAG: hypothetical protein ABIR29_03650 [Chthoniobacterales bacterium]
MTKFQKKSAIILGGALLLLLAGYFALTKTVDHYLNDGALARKIGKKTALILKADAGYLPLSWRGLYVRSDGLLVRGKRPRGLTELQAKNLRASFSLHELWLRKIVIRRLHADRLEAAFGSAAAGEVRPILSAQPELQPQVEQPSLFKVDIRETIVDQLNIFWGEKAEALGALRDVHAEFRPSGPDLDAIGTGGTLRQTGWPELRIVRAEAHYAKPRLELRSVRFAIGKKEDTKVTGMLDLGQPGGLHLQVQSKNAPVAPFLNGSWRGKFEGQIDGEARIDKSFAPDAKASASGKLKISGAELHDVVTLDRLAALTRHPEFAHLKLSQLSGRYDFSGARLEVKELRLEAKNLFRIEGRFVIEEKQIDGRFQIGATAEVLDAIPGAREYVFTEARDGYFWTSLKLSGPLKNPREDLRTASSPGRRKNSPRVCSHHSSSRARD